MVSAPIGAITIVQKGTAVSQKCLMVAEYVQYPYCTRTNQRRGRVLGLSAMELPEEHFLSHLYGISVASPGRCMGNMYAWYDLDKQGRLLRPPLRRLHTVRVFLVAQ